VPVNSSISELFFYENNSMKRDKEVMANIL
jgi:hypothetical protein